MTSLTRLGTMSLITLSLLAGCGVDGAPKPPETTPGVSVSGDARVGVVYSK